MDLSDNKRAKVLGHSLMIEVAARGISSHLRKYDDTTDYLIKQILENAERIRELTDKKKDE